MDATECLGFPYPQCEPPLTKDASDIIHVRDLAEAVDAVVQDFADDIVDQLVRPDACRMVNLVAYVSTLADNVIPMDATSFDNQPGLAMTDVTNGGIRIVTDGWYQVGAWVRSTVATDVQTRIRFLVNGDPATNFQGPGGLAQAGSQDCNGEEVLQLVAGDLVNVATRNGAPGTSVSYSAHMWAVLVAPSV